MKNAVSLGAVHTHTHTHTHYTLLQREEGLVSLFSTSNKGGYKLGGGLIG